MIHVLYFSPFWGELCVLLRKDVIKTMSAKQTKPTTPEPKEEETLEDICKLFSAFDAKPDSPSTTPSLNRYNDPPESASIEADSSPTKQLDSEDFAFADLSVDSNEDVVRGSDSPPFKEYYPVDNAGLISIEDVFLSIAINEFRQKLRSIYTSIDALAFENSSCNDLLLSLSKSLLDEHKSFVDSFAKQQSLIKKTNQMLSGVVDSYSNMESPA